MGAHGTFPSAPARRGRSCIRIVLASRCVWRRVGLGKGVLSPRGRNHLTGPPRVGTGAFCLCSMTMRLWLTSCMRLSARGLGPGASRAFGVPYLVSCHEGGGAASPHRGQHGNPNRGGEKKAVWSHFDGQPPTPRLGFGGRAPVPVHKSHALSFLWKWRGERAGLRGWERAAVFLRLGARFPAGPMGSTRFLPLPSPRLALQGGLWCAGIGKSGGLAFAGRGFGRVGAPGQDLGPRPSPSLPHLPAPAPLDERREA